MQHKEGGIVSGIHVKEGDEVTKGQVLIDLNGDETEANADALLAQFIDLKAREARLMAEQRESSNFAEPAELADLGPQYRPLIDAAMQLQQKTMAANRNFLDTQLSVLTQRAQQTKEQIVGDQQQMSANQQRQTLSQDELTGVKDLQTKGYAPMTRVRALSSRLPACKAITARCKPTSPQPRPRSAKPRCSRWPPRSSSWDQVLSDLNDVLSKLKTMEPQLIAAAGGL